jgi:hypothetical protein
MSCWLIVVSSLAPVLLEIRFKFENESTNVVRREQTEEVVLEKKVAYSA